MNYYPEFSELLKEYLEDNDRKPAWLARQLDIHSSTVSRWLLDATRPSKPEVVGQIADFLSIHNQEDRTELMEAAGYAYVAGSDPLSNMAQVTVLSEQQEPTGESDSQADTEPSPSLPLDGKYNIQINGGEGIVIGEQKKVVMNFAKSKEDDKD